MILAAHAAEQPERPAVVMSADGTSLSYLELDQASNRLAQLFRARGLLRGDHIAVLMENQPMFFVAIWAALRSGLYVTPISVHLTSREASFILSDCGARGLVTSGAQRELAIALDQEMLASLDVRLMVQSHAPEYESFEDAVGRCSVDPVDDESPGSLMLYTSGTTGRPRGVMHELPDETSEFAYAQILSERYRFRQKMVYLSTGPLYHGAPINYCTNVHRLGGTVVVMERFEPTDALRALERFGVTHSQWVPTMFVRMLRLPEQDRQAYRAPRHEVAIHSAAPCPMDIKRQMIDWWGPIIYEYYGGTEGVGSTAITPLEWLEHPGSVGRSQRGRIHILDPTGNELPVAEIGVVYFSGGSSFAYHNDPDKTREAHLEGGLATLGDIGYLDPDGYLYLTDRKDYTINVGGVNIYPREIEDVLITHPDVVDVGVFGVPDEEFGEQVRAVVQLLPGCSTDAEQVEELLKFASQRISVRKLPRSIDFMDQMPRLPSGKLDKQALREEYWQGRPTRIV